MQEDDVQDTLVHMWIRWLLVCMPERTRLTESPTADGQLGVAK